MEDFGSEGIMVKVVQDESLYKHLVLLKLFLSKKQEVLGRNGYK